MNNPTELPAKRIPLCVPFGDKDIVKSAGARWCPEEKLWYCTEAHPGGDSYTTLRRFVPRFYRHDLGEPVIRPWLVPQPLWGINLRSLLREDDWNIIRKDAYRKCGYRCIVCGEKGPEWPVEADEAWHYDDDSKTSVLKGVIGLCPPCHAIRHWGRTSKVGGAEEAYTRLKKLNRWSDDEADRAIDEAYALWSLRSECDWTLDIEWVGENYAVGIREDAFENSRVVHNDIVDTAREQSEREIMEQEGRGDISAYMNLRAKDPEPKAASLKKVSTWLRIFREIFSPSS